MIRNTELIDKLVDFRIGMDAALGFAKNNLPDSKGNERIAEARSSLGRACLYLGSPNPYKNADQMNPIIEDATELSDVIDGANPGYVFSVKSMINACELYLGEISAIRVRPLPSSNIPVYGFLLLRSLNRCIDHLEDAIGLYLRDLRGWKGQNTKEYNDELSRVIETTAPEDAVRTDSMMKARSNKK